jgi:alpha-N-acetylglucosaminidase
MAQQGARALAQRVLGDRASAFVFERQDAAADYFVLEQKGDRLCITANNDNSMAMGLNYYLKEFAHTHVSWFASEPVELPAVLPKVPRKLSRQCQMPVRFFLNYCTYGYTMVWWQWKEWERFIDWMALNGVNMPLALTGQEAVWQEVWREMGLSDDAIRAYFSGPAHLPWHRMANLDGFGGPPP